MTPASRDPLEFLRRFNNWGDRLPYAAVGLALRLFPAAVFWASARTKVDGWQIAESTWYLFEHEYALPLIPSAVAAVLATLAEHLLSVALVLGLMTRLSALGLLTMTLVIQTFVYPEAWMTHGLWAACLLALIRFGPGALSLDALLGLDGRMRSPAVTAGARTRSLERSAGSRS
ncbi:DoxX family protein [Rubellimicrobium roseum]|uniref:DoxX family protein n=1 Tax=Rubellimicrobium roseum TaxID=687525 RepID=A0A5C4NJ48_9RHOB|nr:DoxX family protein [Rubellimicrobium roseum]TNC73086.1 DoxX family protein [Rubellimicrobium roseum]